MKARFERCDQFEMGRKRFGFNKADVNRIYAGLDVRYALAQTAAAEHAATLNGGER